MVTRIKTVPKCKYCGRGYLLKASPDGVGFICDNGCSNPPVIPHISYYPQSTSKVYDNPE
jgi:hypothetical protein